MTAWYVLSLAFLCNVLLNPSISLDFTDEVQSGVLFCFSCATS